LLELPLLNFFFLSLSLNAKTLKSLFYPAHFFSLPSSFFPFFYIYLLIASLLLLLNTLST
jgi:hypothetical protein